MWFQEFNNTREINLDTQGLGDSELEGEFIYDFNSTMNYFIEGSNAIIRVIGSFQ
jgi:hypothetical protein